MCVCEVRCLIAGGEVSEEWGKVIGLVYMCDRTCHSTEQQNNKGTEEQGSQWHKRALPRRAGGIGGLSGLDRRRWGKGGVELR